RQRKAAQSADRYRASNPRNRRRSKGFPRPGRTGQDAIRELDQERIENASLRSALAELRTGYDSLHDNFRALEKRAAELDSDRAGSRQQLAQAQQTARGLQRDKSELTNEIAAARANLEQMEMSLAAVQAERSALSTTRDAADERHQSEAYTLNLRIEAL